MESRRSAVTDSKVFFWNCLLLIVLWSLLLLTCLKKTLFSRFSFF
jgi:hypothetical protein